MANKTKRQREAFEEREKKRARRHWREDLGSTSRPKRTPFIPKKSQQARYYEDIPTPALETQPAQPPAENPPTAPEETAEDTATIPESQQMDLVIHD